MRHVCQSNRNEQRCEYVFTLLLSMSSLAVVVLCWAVCTGTVRGASVLDLDDLGADGGSDCV